jgi:hypothetical protein
MARILSLIIGAVSGLDQDDLSGGSAARSLRRQSGRNARNNSLRNAPMTPFPNCRMRAFSLIVLPVTSLGVAGG